MGDVLVIDDNSESTGVLAYSSGDENVSPVRLNRKHGSTEKQIIFFYSLNLQI